MYESRRVACSPRQRNRNKPTPRPPSLRCRAFGFGVVGAVDLRRSIFSASIEQSSSSFATSRRMRCMLLLAMMLWTGPACLAGATRHGGTRGARCDGAPHRREQTHLLCLSWKKQKPGPEKSLYHPPAAVTHWGTVATRRPRPITRIAERLVLGIKGALLA